MSRLRLLVNTFNTGEISPLVRGRIDQAKYFNSLDTCLNWVPLLQGAIRVRGGLKYAGAAKSNTTACYLVPFILSAAASYILEFGNLYIRFWKYDANGEPVQIGAPYEVTTTYTEAELSSLQVRQSGSVLFIIHPSHAPAKLTRVTDTSWTLSNIGFSPPPTHEPKTDLAQTLGIGANTGASIKFRAAAAVFLAGDVGREITSGAGRAVITVLDNATQVTVEILDAFAATITAGPNTLTSVGTTVTSTAHGLSTGNYIIITSGAHSGQARRVVSVTDLNIVEVDEAFAPDIGAGVTWNKSLAIASGSWFLEGSPNAYCKASVGGPKGAAITLSLYTSGDLDVAKNGWRSGDVSKHVHLLGGTVKITAYTSAAVVTGTVITYLTNYFNPVVASVTYALPGTWTLESDTWTTARGYPSAISLGEQRVFYAGAAGEPDTIRGTITGDYYDFSPGTDDDDALKYVLATEEVNLIRWLHYWKGLICGTLGSEIVLDGGGSNAPMTPDQVNDRAHTVYGSHSLSPDRVGNALLFVERGGRRVREFLFDFATDSWTAEDLTAFADHLTKTSTLTRSTYQKTPYSLVWYVRSDGPLCCLTYDRKHQVVGWSRQTTTTPGGESDVMSGAVIPNPVLNRDDLWLSITRTINGATKRTIEVLDWDRFLDCSIKYSGAAAATITGLSHLNGDSVYIRGKGSTDSKWRLYPNQTVASGQVTGLSPTVTEAEVGYVITATATTPRLEGQGIPSLQGRIKGFGAMVLRCYETPVLKIGSVRYKGGGEGKGLVSGYVSNAVYVIPTGTSAIADTAEDGEIEVAAGTGYDRNGRVTLVQDLPVGGTVLLLAAEVDIGV